MDHFLTDPPSLMYPFSGELFFPALLSRSLHLGHGNPEGSQFMETSLFSFLESLYGLRPKTGSEAPYSRKETQEIEATIIREILKKGGEKVRDHFIAHYLNKLMCANS